MITRVRFSGFASRVVLPWQNIQIKLVGFAVASAILLLCSAQIHAQAIAQGRLLASDAAPAASFSHSIDIDGDVAVISNSNSTNPYVFERVNGVWTEVARLPPGESTTDFNYGYVVAVSGNTIAVGAIKVSGALPRYGAVHIFEKTGGIWVKVAKLTASDPNTQLDGFGASIDLSGARLVVGDAGFNGANDSGPAQGAAYVYVKNLMGWQFETKLIASDRAPFDNCGGRVAIDADRVLVGCIGSDNGNASSNFNAGAAYVYQRNANAWLQTAKLTAAMPAGTENFSTSIALSGNRIAVGVPNANSGGLARSGAVDSFEFDGATWTRNPRLISPDLLANQNFGNGGIAFSGTSLLVGIPARVVNNQPYGSMYMFKQATSASAWASFTHFEPYDNVASQFFGAVIAASNETIMVSATAHNNGRGAAYLLFDGILFKDGFESL